MSIGSFLKSIFRKKEVKEEPKEEVVVEEGMKRFCDNECQLCFKEVGYDRWKKMQGKYFHKSCWKKKLNEVKRGRID